MRYVRYCSYCMDMSVFVRGMTLIFPPFLLFPRNTASDRNPAYVCGSDLPYFNMLDSILLLLERSKNSQWVSRPHSNLFATAIESSSHVEMSVCFCRTKTSWSHCSTRCMSIPQLRFPLQWRYSSIALILHCTVMYVTSIIYTGNWQVKYVSYVSNNRENKIKCIYVLCHAGISGSHAGEDIPRRGLLLGRHSYGRRLCPLQIWQTC